MTDSTLINYFRICNETYSKTTSTTEELIHNTLPNLFQSHILCAGTDIGKQGSCFGDSGGPLMIFNRTARICKFYYCQYFGVYIPRSRDKTVNFFAEIGK